MSKLSAIWAGIASMKLDDTGGKDHGDKIMNRKYKNRPSPKLKKTVHKRHKKRGY